MSKWKSKPTIVEAWQFDGINFNAAPEWLDTAVGNGDIVLRQNYDEGVLELRLTTIQGQWVYAKPGEWVICENVEGRFYPCADEVFRAKYEPAE